jgi:hypothetical protein
MPQPKMVVQCPEKAKRLGKTEDAFWATPGCRICQYGPLPIPQSLDYRDHWPNYWLATGLDTPYVISGRFDTECSHDPRSPAKTRAR